MPIKFIITGLSIVFLTACVSTGPQAPNNPYGPDIDYEDAVIAEPVDRPNLPPEIPAPTPRDDAPPSEPIIEQPIWFDNLPGWAEADHRQAFIAYKRSCESWKKANPDKALNINLPEYGFFRDWLPSCAQLTLMEKVSVSEARRFFETEFAPISVTTQTKEEGLLTGYYEPEIEVRLLPDAEYSEPVLAKPTSDATLRLPRSSINASSSRIIGYGKPIDVFFMQIQGSGRLRYENGFVLRAAYAANNGHPYKSIGRVLVDRGEMTLGKASKQAIENWMRKNGPVKTKALMNENPRYIYFAEQAIASNEGPRGAMQVPLTDMGSIAVDPLYHPYGTLVWLDTTIPRKPGDYKGKRTGLLVSAQDTGSAIKGPLRADLFFGSGKEAGNKAGVMKHPARWTILVPRAIAPRGAPIS